MSCYSVSHMADGVLLRELMEFDTHDRAATVGLLVRLAEVEFRKLYLPAAHSSMYSYCIREMHMSEDIALKRLRAARAARRFPAIYAGLADGRLHLSGVALMARHLKKDNWQDLLSASVHKTKAEIERMLAERFPQPDVPTRVQAVAPAVATEALAFVAPPPVPGPAENSPAPGPVNSFALVASSATSTTAKEVTPPTTYPRVTPLSPGRFAWQMTVNQHTQDQMDYARAMLGHTVPSGAMEAIMEQAMDALVEKLERRKFAKCTRSRPRRGAPKGRYVPAEVRRAVWQRDEGRCTFASSNGKRCEATHRLEFDHIEPVAKGGQSTASNLRLRCRAHNQYAADCAFGAGFMQTKREEARRQSPETKARAEGRSALAGALRTRGTASRGLASCVGGQDARSA